MVDRQSGFTLIELLVVIVIAGMMYALVPPMFGAGIAGTELKKAARQVAAGLRQTRGEAINQHKDVAMTLTSMAASSISVAAPGSINCPSALTSRSSPPNPRWTIARRPSASTPMAVPLAVGSRSPRATKDFSSTWTGLPVAWLSLNEYAARLRRFFLLEILVAFVIMALALGVLMRVFSGALNSTAVAEHYAEALLVAESKLAAIGVETPLSDAETSEQTESGLPLEDTGG